MAVITPTNSILSQAQQVCKDVNSTIECSHQLANQITEIKNGSFVEMVVQIAKLGNERRCQYLHHMSETLRIAKAIGEAVRDLEKSPDFFDQTSLDLAQAHFGMGRCSAMATQAMIKTASFAYSILCSTSEGPKLCNEKNNHAFVLLAEQKEEAETIIRLLKGETDEIEVEAFLNEIPRTTVVLDPFLNVTFQISDLKTKGKDLLEYNKIWKISHVVICNGLNKNSARIPALEADAIKVYQLAQKKLEKVAYDNLFAGFLKHDLQQAIGKLKTQFPGMNWKGNIKTGVTVFCTCNKEQSSAIVKELDAHHIQCTVKKLKDKDEAHSIKPEEKFCIILQNPNLQSLV